MVNRRIKKGQ